MATIIPIFRIFDYDKAIEFYINWLGFKIDWEHKETGTPIYMQVSMQGILLHLTEHHGDCTPGARAYIADFENLKDFHQLLLAKDYKFNRPGLEKQSWNDQVDYMEVIDPFGNRLSFNG
ncbi:glyoxalase superfamily protein [Pedobacter cryoconitis]|uniref:glyoxalase superfamily protein n=1 Tax=Pedobacter cryoconitis TaxID=188932 RepID=UPI0016215936|nr:glyoxalase superfamily protein [Pedobacter cryoconitis]MBB5645233.1 catechol 2,3-dioxygenase-like lactoylglutathione lyase family enzyme [Pedobacter cryoconitis]